MKAVTVGLLALSAVVASVGLWGAVTAEYGGAQVVDETSTAEPTATPSIYDQLPTVLYAHPNDANYDGVVNVVDLFLTARDVGQRGAPAVCAIIIVEGNSFELATCP